MDIITIIMNSRLEGREEEEEKDKYNGECKWKKVLDLMKKYMKML